MTSFLFKRSGTVFHTLLMALLSFWGLSSKAATPELAINSIINLPAPAITTFRPPLTSNLATDGVYLYGTTTGDNIANFGTLYRVKPSGQDYQVLHTFSQITGSLPTGDLAIVGANIYGVTAGGGQGSSDGVVYRIGKNGANYQVIHDFASPSASTPISGLTYFDGNLYGTTSNGSTTPGSNSGNGFGTIYKISLDASGATAYSLLHSFGGSDGSTPIGGLTISGGVVYGTTAGGSGGESNGTVFRINVDGSEFRSIYGFDALDGRTGDTPHGRLFISSEGLIGTTRNGGSTGSGVPGSGFGAIFSINSDGSSFQLLHSFDSTAHTPLGGLAELDGVLYGLTAHSGEPGFGTLYRILRDGSQFGVISQFDGINGALPIGSLQVLNGSLYGNSYLGGLNNSGTVFVATLSAPVPEGSAALYAVVGLAMLGAARRHYTRR